MDSPTPSFLVDQMLRGLAKWLRYLGFSSHTVSDMKQAENLSQKFPEAIFLTASITHYHQFPGNSGFLIKSDVVSEQLSALDDAFQIFLKMNILSLCSRCNTPVIPIDKSGIQDQVPPKVWEVHNEFRQCPDCQRIYWHGGHVKRLSQKMKRMGIPIIKDL